MAKVGKARELKRHVLVPDKKSRGLFAGATLQQDVHRKDGSVHLAYYFGYIGLLCSSSFARRMTTESRFKGRLSPKGD